MTKAKIFFWLSLSFLAGVFGASFYYPKIIEKYYLFIILTAAIAIFFIFYKHELAYFVSFLLVFFIFGFFLTSTKLEKINKIEDHVSFSGKVKIIKKPEIKGNYQNITVIPMTWTSDVQVGKILVNTGIFPEYNYGDEIDISCSLEIPKNKDAKFDYRMYLAKDEIFWQCKNPEIKKINKNNENRFYATLINIKNKVNGNISRFIPAPESGLLSGLLIGGDDLLSKDYQNAFSRTGLTHIVAVSGYNVTIIAEYLMILGIFLGLWRRQAFWFAVFGIILFVTLVGLPASAVRAGIMGILLIWAMKNGRLANSQNAVIFSAVVMLLLNPLLLRWDIGFQLSFLATLGIIYIYPLFQNYFVKKQRALGLAEILFLTISAQIFVLPIIFINFQKLSLISPLANLLVLPIIPLTMLLGFIAVLFSFVFFPLAQVFFWLAYLPLKYETAVVRYLAGLRFASIEISNFSWIGVVLWYIVLSGIIYFINKKQNV